MSVRPPLHVSQIEILHFKDLHFSVINRIATQTFREKTTTRKPILSFKLIFTLTWITEKELEREINNKGDQFRRKSNMKIL